ncbi:hypothetical protein ONS95_006529 [Cadophora gregata]|uniref:uncharacterized protein n=1 Tax=Cadophora gregata TaxID=51156 RepID=UPI0026DD8986|nr:uncharacterized protein ONS95_006529 [Cadophora gregata]KAK0101354.1 hypothetical protein ONS95_006529 [Cadophora gregata]KAK0106636.1 hypothetical protein ONS96_004257 [Cadophora gregata f. sp. sojae]
MEDLPRRAGGIPRKPVPSSNEVYQIPTSPPDLSQLPLASSQDIGDISRKNNFHSSTDPLIRETEYYPVPGNEGSTKSQSFRVEQQSQSRLLGAVKDWKVETFCCVFGIVSLGAIAATLAPFQNRPLPQLPYEISLNSLISLYVIMLKTAMFVILCSGLGQLKWTWFSRTRPLQDLERFDEASRGAWGAVKLIFSLRGRNLLVTLGALITVIAIAIDPFAQQIVKYSSCEQISTISQGFIPRTNSFSNRGIHIGANLNTVDLGMQSAVNVGIFSPSTVITPFTCSTGNCTFPEYRSIAYCGGCADISSNVTITQSNSTTIWSDNSTSTLEGPLNFTLPSGLFGTPMVAHQFAIGPSSGNFEAIMGDSNGPYLVGGGDVSRTNYACAPGLEWGCRGYGAAQCSLEMCIKTYNATVQNGNLTEREIGSEIPDWNNTDPKTGDSSFYISTIDMSCLNNNEKKMLKDAGYSWNDTTKWLGYHTIYPVGADAAQLTDTGFKNVSESDVSSLNASCVYQTISSSITSIAFYLASHFDGYAGTAPQYDSGSNDITVALFQSGNVSTTTLDSNFRNVSIAMTNFIRQNGGLVSSNASAQEAVIGRVLLSETCVHVRWEWFTFPVALFLFTMLFFAATVVKTSSKYALASGSHDFKSFALPLVFTWLEAEDGTRVVTEQRFGMEEMKAEARRMQVRLSKTQEGWRFVKDD